MVVMVAMVALWEKAILELEEPVSTKVIALETTASKLTAVKTVAKAAIKTTVVKLVEEATVTLVKHICTTAHTCIHC
jgi:hypothetical protein